MASLRKQRYLMLMETASLTLLTLRQQRLYGWSAQESKKVVAYSTFRLLSSNFVLDYILCLLMGECFKAEVLTRFK